MTRKNTQAVSKLTRSAKAAHAVARAASQSAGRKGRALRQSAQEGSARLRQWLSQSSLTQSFMQPLVMESGRLVVDSAVFEPLEIRQMLSATWNTYSAGSPASQSPQAIMKMLAPALMVGAPITVEGESSTVGAGTPNTSNYTWNFGDSSDAFSTINGFNDTHIYSAAGTYTVSLTVTNDLGKSSTVSTQLTIAPDTRTVIYVDSSAGNDNNSGLSPSAPLKTAAKADSMLTNNTEVLFKRGETFDLSTSFNVTNTNVIVGAYGTGTVPEMYFTGNVLYDNIMVSTSTGLGVTFENMNLVGGTGLSNMPSAVSPGGYDIAVVGCQFNNVLTGVNANTSATGILVQDCSALQSNSLVDYFVWDQSTDVSVLGNYAVNSETQHIFRSDANIPDTAGNNNILVSYNNFTNNDGKGDIEVHWGQYAWIAHNTCSGGDIRVGPLGENGESASSSTTYAVINANTVQNGSWINVTPGAHDISITNNYINSDAPALIYVSGPDGQGRSNQNILIANNTGYNSGTQGNFLEVGGSVSGVSLENNLYIAPNLQPGSYGTAPVYVDASNLSGFTVINGNVWQLPSTILKFANGGINFFATSYVSSGYQTAAEWNSQSEVGTDYFESTSTTTVASPSAVVADGEASLNLSAPMPASGSVAATADSPVGGVYTDFYANTRPSSDWSAGAVQYGMSASPVVSINFGPTSNTGSSGTSGSSSSTSLPSGWTNLDIGTTGAKGSASYSNGVYSVTASGANIMNNSDAFNYTYTTLSGNGTIVAEVDSISAADTWAKAGVMLRDGTAANAKEISMVLSPNGYAQFQSRSSVGGSTTQAQKTSVSSKNEYVKLVRSGNTVTGYISSNDSTWTEIGTATVSLDSTLQVGLAVDSHDTGQIATASFSNVSITT